MEFTSKKISLSLIDRSDKAFEVRRRSGDDLLKKSLNKAGMINSPYLMLSDAPDKYKIICGFKRIQAAFELGWKEITANVIDDCPGEKELFLLALYDNLSGFSFNPVEKADIVKSLLNYFSEEEVIKKYLSLLDMTPVFNSLEESLLISALDPEIKQGIVENTVARKNAVSLSRMGEDALPLFRLFLKVNFSTSKQAEIIDNCCDISKRDTLSIAEILTAKEIRAVLSREDLTLSQKGDKIRLFLRRKRFPRLVSLEDGFLKLKKSLGLTKNIRFESPPSFEGDVYSLQINLRTVEELKSSADHLKRVSESPLLKEFLGEVK